MLNWCTLLIILLLTLKVQNILTKLNFCQVSLTYKVSLNRIKEDISILDSWESLFSKQNILLYYFTFQHSFFPPYLLQIVQVID